MSKSEDVKRFLNQAAELAKEQIVLLENDVSCLTYQLNQERKKTKMLEDSVQFETDERISQERKSDASLMCMFVVCCFSVAAMTKAILTCQ